MAEAVDGWGGPDEAGTTRRRLARFGVALRGRLSWRRVGFTLLVCVLISTQLLFQPSLYHPWLPGYVAQRWLDYFGECLIMGAPILLAATIAEILVPSLSRIVAIAAVTLALVTGALAGALLLIPYYGLPLESAFDGRFISDVVYWLVITAGIVAIYAFQRRTDAASGSLHQAEVDQIALSKQMLEARLQLMRAQIEPHFLFNTLANIKRLTETDVGSGIAMLDNLVAYLMAALPKLREAQTTLGQEADLTGAYLDVLKVRMGTRLRSIIDIPERLQACAFPPMTLLTLAENAVKHGLDPSPYGGAIAIRAEAHDGQLIVRVSDSGVGFGGAPTAGTGVGLANIRARLAALYGEAASLDLSAVEPSGVLATIRVPLSSRETVRAYDPPANAEAIR